MPDRAALDFPVYRMKVDDSLFRAQGLVAPEWACRMWNLPRFYRDVFSRNDVRSQVVIYFQRNSYSGHVTTSRHHRNANYLKYKIWFDKALTMAMRHTFSVSYLRSLEHRLNSGEAYSADSGKADPLAEYMDIKFDHTKAHFRLTPYYQQKPIFPHLFHKLIETPAIHRMYDEAGSEGVDSMYRQDWSPRKNLIYELGASNVVFMLADVESSQLYVGDAPDLIPCLTKRVPEIPRWTHYCYHALPDKLESMRPHFKILLQESLEILLMGNEQQTTSLQLSDYHLVSK